MSGNSGGPWGGGGNRGGSGDGNRPPGGGNGPDPGRVRPACTLRRRGGEQFATERPLSL